ncbi:MAG: DUF3817 domain-containing protein [Verrucomicrobia bacterium]|nr:DUF3817 domain-containing protein [Verrucomicrobiota bacterium]
MNESTTSNRIRIAVLVEGVSFLLLLFVAMPLKYLADLPLAVKYVGWAHGLLFIILCGLLFQGLITGSIRFSRAVLVFIASLIPFAPFVINHRLK